MRKSQTEPAVLTAQREMLLQIQRKMEVTTPVIMTIPDIDTIFHFDGAEDMKYHKKM